LRIAISFDFSRTMSVRIETIEKLATMTMIERSRPITNFSRRSAEKSAPFRSFQLFTTHG
jgi:hypothetical protein